MIPDEGLIGSYRGQMILTVVLLVLGAIACAALTIAVMVRKAPPLTTQVDLVTGKKEHGIGRWWLFFASFTIGPPLAFGIVRTLIAAVDALTEVMPYWWIFAGVGGVSVVCWLVVRKVGVMRSADRITPSVAAAAPEPAQQPVMGWSLDPDAPPLDAR